MCVCVFLFFVSNLKTFFFMVIKYIVLCVSISRNAVGFKKIKISFYLNPLLIRTKLDTNKTYIYVKSSTINILKSTKIN